MSCAPSAVLSTSAAAASTRPPVDNPTARATALCRAAHPAHGEDLRTEQRLTALFADDEQARSKRPETSTSTRSRPSVNLTGREAAN